MAFTANAQTDRPPPAPQLVLTLEVRDPSSSDTAAPMNPLYTITTSPENGWSLTSQSRLADLKLKLEELYKTPAWAMDLSWKGQSLRGKAHMTFAELGIGTSVTGGKGTAETAAVVQVDNWCCLEDRCSTHPDGTGRNYLCMDCSHRMCPECGLAHSQEHRAHKIVPLKANFADAIKALSFPQNANSNEAPQVYPTDPMVSALQTKLDRLKDTIAKLQQEQRETEQQLSAAVLQQGILQEAWRFEPVDYSLGVLGRGRRNEHHPRISGSTVSKRTGAAACVGCLDADKHSRQGVNSVAFHGKCVDLCTKCFEALGMLTPQLGAADGVLKTSANIVKNLHEFIQVNSVDQTTSNSELQWIDVSSNGSRPGTDWACEGIFGIAAFPTKTSSGPLELKHVQWIRFDEFVDPGQPGLEDEEDEDGLSWIPRQLGRLLKLCPGVKSLLSFPTEHFDERIWSTVTASGLLVDGIVPKDRLVQQIAKFPNDHAYSAWLTLGKFLETAEKIPIGRRVLGKPDCLLEAAKDSRFKEWRLLATAILGKGNIQLSGMQITEVKCLAEWVIQNPIDYDAWRQLMQLIRTKKVNEVKSVSGITLTAKQCMRAVLNEPSKVSSNCWASFATLLCGAEVVIVKDCVYSKVSCCERALEANPLDFPTWLELARGLEGQCADVSGMPHDTKTCLSLVAFGAPDSLTNPDWVELARLLRTEGKVKVTPRGDRAAQVMSEKSCLILWLDRWQRAKCESHADSERLRFSEWKRLAMLLTDEEEVQPPKLLEGGRIYTKVTCLIEWLNRNPKDFPAWSALVQATRSTRGSRQLPSYLSVKDCLIKALNDPDFSHWGALVDVMGQGEVIVTSETGFQFPKDKCSALAELNSEAGESRRIGFAAMFSNPWAAIARNMVESETVKVKGKVLTKRDVLAQVKSER